MQKVGIATMCGGDNYGNALQNYAVQSLINRFGYEAVTLNNQTRAGFPDNAKPEKPLFKKLTPKYIAAYRRSHLTERYGCKNDRDLHGVGLRTAKQEVENYRTAQKRRHEKFDAFRAEMLHIDTVPMSVKQYDREHLSAFYAFVCGSDQVWNPYFYENSMIDFLQFAPKQKRIAFAPSFGVSEIPEIRREEYSRWLREIPRLSVREQAGADIIEKLTGLQAAVLLDPTFGLTAQDWECFECKPDSAPTGKYVFCYFLGNRCRKYGRWIEKFAKINDCEIVDICDIRDLRHYDVDPREFVWLLHHAQAVFTDSFHGTAFSINLEKPFVVFERVEGGSSMSSRITTVLNKTGLQERLFTKIKAEQVMGLSFQTAQAAIAQERERMKTYLQQALAQVGDDTQPLLAERRRCTGCSACANACPSGAITMQPDSEGFLYPHIDPKHCLNCKACERACPQDRTGTEQEAPAAFYAYAKEDDICRRSSSGGLFTLLAAVILKKGGVVFGAGFDENFRVCHKEIRSEEEINQLRTSKYVQSDLGLTLRRVRELLKDGKTVLFTGTPCQIAALKSFLGKDWETLYTQDIICHGVPSPGNWERYLEQCHGEKAVTAVNFRDKTYGWNNFAMRMTYADDTSYCVPAVKDPFESAFLANLNLRPSCYQCQYKTLSHASDLTLADYWGVELVHPELREQQGVSLLLIHTPKGQTLLDKIAPQLSMGPTDRDRAIGYNQGALHSVPWPRRRTDFFAMTDKMGIDKAVKLSLKVKPSKKLKRIMRRTAAKIAHLLGIKRRK